MDVNCNVTILIRVALLYQRKLIMTSFNILGSFLGHLQVQMEINICVELAF